MDQQLLFAISVQVQLSDVDSRAVGFRSMFGWPGHPVANRHGRLFEQAVAVAMSREEILSQRTEESIAKRPVMGHQQARQERLSLRLERDLGSGRNTCGHSAESELRPLLIHFPETIDRSGGIQRMKCPLRRIEAAAACAVLQPSELIFDDGTATTCGCVVESPTEPLAHLSIKISQCRVAADQFLDRRGGFPTIEAGI